MSIEEKQLKIIADFATAQDWESRYKKIIALGKALPEISDELKTDVSKVKGCQSQVWLHAELRPDGLIHFTGDSDALLVRGLVALLLQIYDQATPQEILANEPSFFKELQLMEHLSPSRANGLFAMYKQIRHFAMAFQFLQQGKS